MPKLTEEFRQERRRRILHAAWGCFSRDGFHATSMDDVIKATGLSSSAVYRYVSGKDELIEEAARESLRRLLEVFDRLLAADAPPSLAETLRALVAELEETGGEEGYDLTRIALQSWSEGLRRPELAELTRTFHRSVRDRLTDLAARWLAAGALPAHAKPTQVASALVTLLPGLLVNVRLVDGVSADDLARGLLSIGAGPASTP